MVHPKNGLSERQIYHTAGLSPGGLTIFAVHDTKQSWERFRDQTLIPAMQKGIDGGLEGQPQETEIDVFTVHERAHA